jgi:hypothetical protein
MGWQGGFPDAEKPRSKGLGSQKSAAEKEGYQEVQMKRPCLSRISKEEVENECK